MVIGETNENSGSAARIGSRARELSAWLGRPKPIGFYLFLLIFVTLLPAIGVSLVLLERNNEAQREVLTTLAEATAGSIAEGVDRELISMVTTLRVLSTTPSLTEGDIKDFYERAQSALAGTGAYLVLLDEKLNQLMNTRVPLGEELPAISDPGSASHAFKTRGTVISDIVYDETAENWVFNVILPLGTENGPPRLLIMTRNAEDLSRALSEQNLRGGWNASIIDSKGDVVASTFMSSNIGKPFFLLPVDGQSRTGFGEANSGADKQSYETIIKESNYSGWKAVLWAPTAKVEAPMRRSLRALVLGGLIVLAIGAGAAWLLGRQVAKPVRRLARDARRLGAGEPVTAMPYQIAEVATVSSALAEAAVDRKRAENEIRLLMREVAHRAKNQLTVVASIAKQSARNARSFTAFQDSFQKRIHGLARSTDLLIAGGAAGVELRELLTAQVEPFKPDDPKRMELSGPAFRLSNQAAQTIGLAVHELATNASKYGAFASHEGRLSLSWRIKDDVLEIIWREYVPRLGRRSRKRGFGTEIIERMLGGMLDAEISRIFHRNGLECVISIPIGRLLPDGPEQGAALREY
ncbi:two-component sensor histidine kinase [Mesorhizobium sp. J18]|nr:two-component sensor histidine kinase [Mesorhizobium sp. J18]